jgi:hypothetical protein
MPAIKAIRLVPFQVSTSAATTSPAIDLDYRFDGTPVRTFFVQKSAAAGPAVFLEAAPTSTGPWIAFAEVSANAASTVVPFQLDVPFVRTSYAGGGPLVTIYGVV